MATIPDNPTWPEIRAGMEAARDAYRTAKTTRDNARALMLAQRPIVETANDSMRVALGDLQEWEAATRRKVLRGL